MPESRAATWPKEPLPCPRIRRTGISRAARAISPARRAMTSGRGVSARDFSVIRLPPSLRRTTSTGSEQVFRVHVGAGADAVADHETHRRQVLQALGHFVLG